MRTLEQYMRLPYAIQITQDTCDGESCYVAYHPELEGCMAFDKTAQGALDSLREARRDYIHSIMEDGLPVPEPALPLESYKMRPVGVGKFSSPVQELGGLPLRVYAGH